jgi:hypothetical protein
MHYLYVFRMVCAVLVRLCHSGVRKPENITCRGRTFILAPTGSYIEIHRIERNWYLLGIVQWSRMF